MTVHADEHPAARIVGPLAAVLAIAIMARIALPLPFSPVPVTGQTLAVLLAGALLGPNRGLVAVVLYLIAGGVGLPVFADGTSGLPRLTGPTGGFLVGFVPGAFIAGWGAGRLRRRTSAAALIGGLLIAMLVAHAVIFALGISWLARFTGWQTALEKGVYPFLPGALFKSSLAALIIYWISNAYKPGTSRCRRRP